VKVYSKEDKIPVIIPQPAGLHRNRGVEPSSGKVESGSVGKGTSVNPVNTFGEILNAEFEKSRDLKLSAHAERRLRERNVILNREDMQKIEGAVNKAAAKGSRESLVIFGDLALVASVRNKTIITALEGKDMKDHVFTNIDSAVIIRKGDTPAEA